MRYIETDFWWFYWIAAFAALVDQLLTIEPSLSDREAQSYAALTFAGTMPVN